MTILPAIYTVCHKYWDFTSQSYSRSNNNGNYFSLWQVIIKIVMVSCIIITPWLYAIGMMRWIFWQPGISSSAQNAHHGREIITSLFLNTIRPTLPLSAATLLAFSSTMQYSFGKVVVYIYMTIPDKLLQSVTVKSSYSCLLVILCLHSHCALCMIWTRVFCSFCFQKLGLFFLWLQSMSSSLTHTQGWQSPGTCAA